MEKEGLISREREAKQKHSKMLEEVERDRHEAAIRIDSLSSQVERCRSEMAEQGDALVKEKARIKEEFETRAAQLGKEHRERAEEENKALSLKFEAEGAIVEIKREREKVACPT